MLALKILFILISFSCYKSSRYNRAHDDMMKNEIAKVINFYIKPLRHLNANFPQHEVELQIEFHGQQQPQPHLNGRRKGKLFQYKPPSFLHNDEQPIARAGAESTGDDLASPLTPTNPSTSPSTTSEATVSTSSTHISLSEANLTKVELKTEKRTVYWEDLEKALSDLEKLLKSNTNNWTSNNNDSSEQTPQIVISNPGPVSGGSPSIDRIVELLKKGVDVQKHVPKPLDEDLEWMEIKIPKNIKQLA